MGSHVNLNYSSTVFTDHTESSSGGETFSSDVEIAILIQIIVRPILIVFGIKGNGLSFYIMRSTSLKNVSSCFYTYILALADTCKYVAALKLQFFPKYLHTHFHNLSKGVVKLHF